MFKIIGLSLIIFESLLGPPLANIRKRPGTDLAKVYLLGFIRKRADYLRP